MKPDTTVVFTVNLDSAAFRKAITDGTLFYQVEAFSGSCPPSDGGGGKWAATIFVPFCPGHMLWEMHRIPGRGDERFYKPPVEVVAKVQRRVCKLVESEYKK